MKTKTKNLAGIYYFGHLLSCYRAKLKKLGSFLSKYYDIYTG